MAEFHFHKNVVSKSKGHSACAAGAYITGQLINQTISIDNIDAINTHDYTRKKGVYDYFVVAPDNAPEWVNNIEILLNEIERNEKRKDSQFCFSYDLALPIELPKSSWSKLAREYAENIYKSRGLTTLVAIHDDDPKNPHFHMIVSMRKIDENGFYNIKDTSLNKTDFLEFEREQYANICNEYLKEFGVISRVDHGSYKDRNISLKATKHIGKSTHYDHKTKEKIVNKGGVSIEDINQVVKEINAEIAKEMPGQVFNRLMPADKHMVSMSEIDKEAFRLANNKEEYNQIRGKLNNYAIDNSNKVLYGNKEFYDFKNKILTKNSDSNTENNESSDENPIDLGKEIQEKFTKKNQTKILSKADINSSYQAAKDKILSNPRQYLGEFDFKSKGNDYIANAKIDLNGNPTRLSGKVYLYRNNANIYCHKTGSGQGVLDYYAERRRISVNEAVKEINGQIEPRPYIKQSIANSNIKKHIEYSDEQKVILKEAIYKYSTLPTNKSLAIKYLVKERGIKAEIASKMDVGFLPNRNALKLSLLDQGINIDKYQNIINKSFGTYNKLLIPIRDVNNRIVGLSARATNPDSDIKYSNSSFSKNNNLVGINLVEENAKVTIVEGMIDVYSLNAAGVKNVVALGGVSISETQMQLLKNKFVKDIILALDNDNAGKIASNKLSKKLIDNGFNVFLSTIDKGKDLDEVLTYYGVNHVENIIKNATVIKDKSSLSYNKYDDSILSDLSDQVVTNLIRNNSVFNETDVKKSINKTCKEYSIDLKNSVLKYLDNNLINLGYDDLELSNWYIKTEDINNKDIKLEINSRTKGRLNHHKLDFYRKVGIDSKEKSFVDNTISSITNDVLEELKGHVYSESELQFIISKCIYRKDIQDNIKREVFDNIRLNTNLQLLNRRAANKQKLYCLKEQYNLEQNIINLLNEHKESRRQSLPESKIRIKNIRLNNGQRSFVRAVFSGDNITIVEGKPGTGKTTAVKEIVKIAKDNKQKVFGLTSYGIAAKNLADTGIEACTIESWKRNDEWNLNKNSILIVDEAGVVNSEDMHHIIKVARSKNVNLVLMGDKLQAQPIKSGQVFAHLTREFNTINLNEIIRQKDENHIKALNKIYSGNIKGALKEFNDNGDYIKTSSLNTARECSALHYVEDALKGVNSVILAFENKEVDKINQITRSLLVKYEVIKESRYIKKLNMNLGINDRIMFLKNDYDLDVRNGQIGRVIKINNNSIVINSNDKDYKINLSDYNNIDSKRIDYSYGITIDKSQGSTFDSGYLIPSTNMDASKWLVSSSRHKDHFKIITQLDLEEISNKIRYKVKESTLDYKDNNKYLDNVSTYRTIKFEVKNHYTKLTGTLSLEERDKLLLDIRTLNNKMSALHEVISSDLISHSSYINECEKHIIKDFFEVKEKSDEEYNILCKFKEATGEQKALLGDSLRTLRENREFYDKHFTDTNLKEEILSYSNELSNIGSDHYQAKFKKLEKEKFGILNNSHEYIEQLRVLYKDIVTDRIKKDVYETKINAYLNKKEKYENMISNLEIEKKIALTQGVYFNKDDNLLNLKNELTNIKNDPTYTEHINLLDNYNQKLGRFVFDKDFRDLKNILKNIKQYEHENSLLKYYSSKNMITLNKEFSLNNFVSKSYELVELRNQVKNIMNSNPENLKDKEEGMIIKYLNSKYGLLNSIQYFSNDINNENRKEFEDSLDRIINIDNSNRYLDNLNILTKEQLSFVNDMKNDNINKYKKIAEEKGSLSLLEDINLQGMEQLAIKYSKFKTIERKLLSAISNDDLRGSIIKYIITDNDKDLNILFNNQQELNPIKNLYKSYLNAKIAIIDDIQSIQDTKAHNLIIDDIFEYNAQTKQKISEKINTIISDRHKDIKDNITENLVIGDYDKAIFILEESKKRGINFFNFWKSKSRLEAEKTIKTIHDDILSLKTNNYIKSKLEKIYIKEESLRDYITKKEFNTLLKETALSIQNKYEILEKNCNKEEFIKKYTNTNLLDQYLHDEMTKDKNPVESFANAKIKFIIHQEKYTNQDYNKTKELIDKDFNEMKNKMQLKDNNFKDYMNMSFNAISKELSDNHDAKISKATEITYNILTKHSDKKVNIIVAEEICHDIVKHQQVNQDQMRYRQMKSKMISENIQEMHRNIVIQRQKMQGE